MGFQLTQKDIDAVISVIPEAVERVLKVVQVKINMFLEGKDNSMENEKLPKQQAVVAPTVKKVD